MKNLTHFYQSLLTFLERSQWKDKRHLKTAVNMVMGLVLSEAISLTKWTPSPSFLVTLQKILYTVWYKGLRRTIGIP